MREVTRIKNVSQISQWPEEESVRGLLLKHLGIERIPCYYWLLCLLKLIDLKSLNQFAVIYGQIEYPYDLKILAQPV
ncbi:MAG: hypothetical protein FWB82_01685 [Treponema sp.]|nr:hypothetical protein [Treponema sp.]